MNALALSHLLAAQNILVLERSAPGQFAVEGTVPAWASRFLDSDPGNMAVRPEVFFPYLETFLPEAEAFWEGTTEAPPRSGIWNEVGGGDAELPLQASAFSLDQGKYLLIRLLGLEHEEQRKVLQIAREAALDFERLNREINKKEILLHCIIHDLAGPLAGMKGCFDMLAEESLSDQGRQFLELGKMESRKQSNFIKDLLDVFSSEVSSLESFSHDPATAPDLVACARQLLAGLSPAFAFKGVSARLELPQEDEGDWKVTGETSKLDRVLYNLLQNSLRYTPRGGSVTITPLRAGEMIELRIQDDGPGVPDELIPRLFQKFVKSKTGGGKAGLGLFFCRMTVERWGGEIGYEPGSEHGSIFWFRLPKS